VVYASAKFALCWRNVDLVTGQISEAIQRCSVISPIYVSQHWARTIRTTRLAQLRSHDLPHAHATHLLANGVHPKVASERLGRSKVGIRLDRCSHIIPGMQEDAAKIVDAELKLAMQQQSELTEQMVNKITL
jgi:integrase